METYERHAERVWRVLSELELEPLLRRESGSEHPGVQLLAAAQPPSSPVAAAWRERWPTLAVHAVPGDHLGMLTPPNVGAVAARLRELLSPP